MQISLDTRIALAINNDLDILERLPILRGIPEKCLEPAIETYINAIQRWLKRTIHNGAMKHVRNKDAYSLTAYLIACGLDWDQKDVLSFCEELVDPDTSEVPELSTVYSTLVDMEPFKR